jgi:hypothetical protein
MDNDPVAREVWRAMMARPRPRPTNRNVNFLAGIQAGQEWKAQERERLLREPQAEIEPDERY